LGLYYDEERTSYPVFLASVQKPSSSGRGLSWLKHALNRILADYQKWKDKKAQKL